MSAAIHSPEAIRKEIAALVDKEKKEEARHHERQQQLKESLNHLPWLK